MTTLSRPVQTKSSFCKYISKSYAEYEFHLFGDHDLCPYPNCSQPFRLEHVSLAHLHRVPIFQARLKNWLDGLSFDGLALSSSPKLAILGW